jgi:hypothetical protein
MKPFHAATQALSGRRPRDIALRSSSMDSIEPVSCEGGEASNE